MEHEDIGPKPQPLTEKELETVKLFFHLHHPYPHL